MFDLLPDAATFIVFVSALFVLVLSPGPDMLYVLARGIGQGPKAGLFSALGVCVGVFIHSLALAFGLSALFAASPLAFEVVRWIGVAYLAYLGGKCLMDRSPPLISRNETNRLSLRALFLQGVMINLLNPQVALFFIAFLPQFADPAKGRMALQLFFLGLFVVGLGLFVKIIVGISGGVLGRVMAARPFVWRIQRWISGAILIGLAVWLAATGKG